MLKNRDYYYPFGGSIAALSSTAPLSKPNRYKFNGNEEQTEFDLGLMDFNARFYDPMLGRFTSIDPLAERQEEWNPYHFSYNTPVNLSDPTGLDAKLDWSWTSDGGANTYNAAEAYGDWARENDKRKQQYQQATFNAAKTQAKAETDPKPAGNPFSLNINLSTNNYSIPNLQQNVPQLVGPVKQPPKPKSDPLNYASSMAGSFGAVYGAAQLYFTPAADLWRGTNGKYYSTSWGGNQFTGARSSALRLGSTLRVAGQWVAGASVVIDAVSLRRNKISTGDFMSNSFYTGLALIAGPPGWLAATSHFIQNATGGDIRAARLGMEMYVKWKNGRLTHPKYPQSRPKLRNPKFE